MEIGRELRLQGTQVESGVWSLESGVVSLEVQIMEIGRRVTSAGHTNLDAEPETPDPRL